MNISKVGLLHHVCAMIKVQQDHLQQLSTYRMKNEYDLERDRLKNLEDLHDKMLADATELTSINLVEGAQAVTLKAGGLSKTITSVPASTMPEDMLESIRCAIAEKVELINTCNDEATLDYLRGALSDLLELEIRTLSQAYDPEDRDGQR